MSLLMVPIVMTQKGGTALCFASQEGHVTVVRLLLEKGADVNVSNKEPCSILMSSCVDGSKAPSRTILRQHTRCKCYINFLNQLPLTVYTKNCSLASSSCRIFFSSFKSLLFGWRLLWSLNDVKSAVVYDCTCRRAGWLLLPTNWAIHLVLCIILDRLSLFTCWNQLCYNYFIPQQDFASWSLLFFWNSFILANAISRSVSTAVLNHLFRQASWKHGCFTSDSKGMIGSFPHNWCLLAHGFQHLAQCVLSNRDWCEPRWSRAFWSLCHGRK